MSDQFNKGKIIEDYLMGKLSVLEVQEFEQRLKVDKSLSEEVSIQRMLHEVIIDRGLLDIKQKIKTGKFDNNSNDWKTYTLVGVAVLFVSASIGFLIGPNEKKSSSKIQIKSENDIVKLERIEPQTRPTNKLTIKQLNQTKPQQLNQAATNQLNQTTTKTTMEPDNHSSSAPFEKLTTNDSVFDTKIQPEEKKNVLINDSDFKPSVIQENVPSKAKNLKLDSTFLHVGNTTEQEKVKVLEYAFSPSLGQIWEYPIEDDGNFKISILNKNGQLVYQTNVHKGNSSSWNGNGNQGLPIVMGSYIFLIETQDGKITKGYVTITE